MQEAVEATEDELATIRAERVNAAMFDRIVVEYYDPPTLLKQPVSSNISEARIVTIQSSDRNAT